MHGERFDRLDALRGLAIVWMVVFHFCYDLNHFRLLQPVQQFLSDPFWTLQRTAIVSLFLLCAGLGQAVAVQAGQSSARFWRRWAQVAGCALLVSAGSALVFPQRWISFGVLHGIAVMLLIVRLGVAPRLGGDLASARAQGLLWGVGALALLAPRLWQHPLFDQRWAWWTGLVTRLPATEDYVPVLPWLGVLLWGLAIGAWLLAHRRVWLTGTLATSLQPLAWLGARPLRVYMLHQPILFGALLAWTALA
ncbi:MAG: DUF1624 domain-containing protein [Burkholderiales bacterium]|nr:DUF1624 domain-containing protein [Burkholderiales bacterium]